MRRCHFVIPGDIGQPTGGYGYDRQVLAHAAAAGLDLVHLPIPGGYPEPDESALRATREAIAATARGDILLIDGLAYGAMPDALIRAFGRPIVELCHHPLALEPGIAPADADRYRASETAAMALAAGVIVTGRATARIVAQDFGVPAERLAVAEPGTEPAPRAQGSGRAAPHLIAVGSVIARKGYDVLIDAMARLAGLGWTLDIVGSLAHAPAIVAEVQNQIQRAGLSGRIRLRGALDANSLAQAYDKADLFVMSSHYEGYGMVVAEAMARGLPVVATRAGAVADTLDDRAGLKVPVNSIQALAEAIQDMIVNADKRSRFSDGSWAAGQSLPRWGDTAAAIARAIREFVP